MGSSVSLFWVSNNDATIDSATGLTNKQKKIVQNTWAVVRKDPVASGVAVMIAFFKKHPEYQRDFKSFKDVSIDELPSNKRFQAHCMSIITALNDVIDSINDPQLMQATLSIIGERHARRGQTLDQFYHLKEVLVDVFRQKFGSKFTVEVAEAWSKTLELMFKHMFNTDNSS